MAKLSSTLHRRPTLVTWLSLAVLTLSGWQWASAITGFNVPDLSLSLPKAVLIARSALFGLISFILALGLFFGKSWAPRATRWSGVLILVWIAVERMIFGVSEYSIRALAGTVILMLISWVAVLLTLQKQKVKTYFGEHPV